MRSNVLRILIIDDNNDMRRRLRSLVASHDWIVCGEAANGREALELIRQVLPDVVLLDLTMPDISGHVGAFFGAGRDDVDSPLALAQSLADERAEVAIRLGELAECGVDVRRAQMMGQLEGPPDGFPKAASWGFTTSRDFRRRSSTTRSSLRPSSSATSFMKRTPTTCRLTGCSRSSASGRNRSAHAQP